MFEHHSQPVISRSAFFRRFRRFAVAALLLVMVSLAIGILGYHYLDGLSWLESLLNAAMILGGMGPVDPLHTVAGKLFASFYALFSGIIFLISVGVLIAPILHRLMHQFHLQAEQADDDDDDDDKDA